MARRSSAGARTRPRASAGSTSSKPDESCAGRAPAIVAAPRGGANLSSIGRVYEGIDERLATWIAEQQLFFVGSAPRDGDGHVNVSPKGPIGTLRVLDADTIVYLDVIGSGAETIAHLRENGRIVIMLCAFQGPPRIVRLHGRGEVVMPDDRRFAAMLERCDFDEAAAPEARRAVVVVDVTRVADSCGYGVPLMRYEGERPHQEAWAAKKLRVGGPDALVDYQRQKNAFSLDGLPAVELPGPAGSPAGDA